MKILIAPTEIAGSMAMTAKALRNLGLNAISCNLRYKKNPYGYICDIDFGPKDRNLSITKKLYKFFFISTFFLRFDVFHFYFGRTLTSKNRDLPILKSLGKKLVMEFVGSDIRMGNHLLNTEKENISKKDSKKIIYNLKKLNKYIDVALVADWELKTYVEPFFERIEIVRQRIDLEKYQATYPDRAKKHPLIVHAPSNREIKGTEYILAAIEKLKAKYLFDFRLIENLKHSDALEIYSNADIIVDQLRIGTYGGFSVESMALGKPVITYLQDESRQFYPKSLPIVSASIDSIYEVLEELIINAELRHDLGVRGRKYVEEFHDSIKVAKRLRSIYQSL